MTSARLKDLAIPTGLVGGPFGSSLVSADYTRSGVPVIRGENLNAGKWIGGQFVFVSEDKLAADLARNTARPGDVVFTQRGTLGQVALVPSGMADQFVVSQSQMRLRVDETRALAAFLYYACTAPEFLQQIDDRAIATGVPHINLGILGSLEVPLPPLRIQRAIAEVLGALDDKIAANRELSWAADRLASTLARRALTWTSPLGNVADLMMGTSPTGATMNEQGEGIPFFQGVRDFGTRVPKSRVFTVAPIKLAAPGDVLISVRAPVGSVNRADRELCIGRGLAAARSQTPGALLHALRLATVWESFNGEGTVFGSINQSDLRRAEIPWATEPAIIRLERELAPIEARIDQSESESALLAELRDTLLPHLMSGRITVREAEKRVEVTL